MFESSNSFVRVVLTKRKLKLYSDSNPKKHFHALAECLVKVRVYRLDALLNLSVYLGMIFLAFLGWLQDQHCACGSLCHASLSKHLP